MKKPLSIIILILIICGAAMAQAPQGIPYQATARNSSGAILASTAISVRFSIRDSIATGTITYRETHSVTTTAQGMFSVNVGQGTPLIGTFSGINWGTNAKFMQVEMDPTGGSSYVDMGTQQMMSVPYSIYSSSAGNGLPSANNGDILYYNGSNWTKLPAGNEGQVLKMCGGLPTWGPCVALISTRDITGEISSLGINSGGSISSDGGSPVSGRGIVWDSNPNPTIALSTKTSDGTGTGDFYSSIV